SWATSHHSDALFSVPGFQTFRGDRKDDRRGGGILLLISKRFRASVFEPLVDVGFSDSIWCEVILSNNSTALLGAIYRPPNSSGDNDRLLFDSISASASFSHDVRIIAGDFNYPGIDWTTLNCSSSDEHFLLGTFEAGLHQNVFEPTRLNSILDLIFSSSPELITRVDIIEPLGASDHNMVVAEMSLRCSSNNSKDQPPRFNFNKANWDLYRTVLHQANWDILLSSDNVDVIWSNFVSCVKHALNCSVPLKRSHSSNRPPWLSEDLRRLKRMRRDSNSNYRTNPTEENRRLRNHYSNVLKCATRKAVKCFEESVARSNDSKFFFKYVRSKQRPSSNIGPIIDPISKNVVYDPAGMAKIFSEFYQSVFSNESFPVPELPTLSSPCISTINFSTEAIMHHLSRRKSFASPGPDGLLYVCFKEAAHILVPILSRLFSFFFDSGSLPSIWKHAQVVPIYKKGSRKLTSNYRPVSLTCSASKLMECVIRDSLWEFWNEHSLIKHSQFGFRSRSATCYQLLEFLEDVTSSVDRGNWADVIYLDFEKAFMT
ncbi:MAG: hypothetical protein AAFY98_12445, partial [Verrucomicrobiota bacterium]